MIGKESLQLVKRSCPPFQLVVSFDNRSWTERLLELWDSPPSNHGHHICLRKQDYAFFATGTGMPAIFTLTAPR
jgi:hypothetical protein